MWKEFLDRIVWNGRYIKKQGTNTSYIMEEFAGLDLIQDNKAKEKAFADEIERQQQRNKMLLPIRLCFITGEDAAPVSYSGRGMRKRVAQMKSAFTKVEQSPYKIAKPYKCCTSIWEMDGNKRLLYGTIGITQKEGLPASDNGDLIFFYTNGWEAVDIFVFKGLARPNEIATIQEAGAYVIEALRR